MQAEYETFIAHLKRTGRLKLLPRILRELRMREARAAKLAPRRETAAENPSLISGWRSLEGGLLIDKTGKRALLDIYQRIIT